MAAAIAESIVQITLMIDLIVSLSIYKLRIRINEIKLFSVT